MKSHPTCLAGPCSRHSHLATSPGAPLSPLAPPAWYLLTLHGSHWDVIDDDHPRFPSAMHLISLHALSSLAIADHLPESSMRLSPVVGVRGGFSVPPCACLCPRPQIAPPLPSSPA